MKYILPALIVCAIFFNPIVINTCKKQKIHSSMLEDYNGMVQNCFKGIFDSSAKATCDSLSKAFDFKSRQFDSVATNMISYSPLN